MWQVGLRISLLTRGLPTLSWSPTPEPSPPRHVLFWMLHEKQLLKDSPEHFFVAGMDKYFPTSFWWSLSVLPHYWEEIYSINWGLPLWWEAFQSLESYSFYLLLKNPLERDKNFGRTKLTPSCGTRGWANQARLVIIVLQVATQFPNWKQYPLRREAWEGLHPLINKFLACELLTPNNSLCNTPILPVKKKGGTWGMVQDFWIINEAVVPLHPTVSNPYVILGEIPTSAKWFTVLDLNDAFFCIPMA